MKKRRELDALVNGKLGRRKKTVTKGQHELLRNDTDSSDLEEFSIPEKTVVRKRGPSRFCATYVTVCGFFLLISCMMAIGGLVWVHLELKNELNTLRNRLNAEEGPNRGSSESILKLQAEHTQMSEALDVVKNKENDDTSDQQAKLLKLTAKLNELNETTKNLAKGIAEAPALASLPTKVDELNRQLASMGSDIQSLKDSVGELNIFKTDLRKQMEALTEQINNLSPAPDEAHPDKSGELAPGVSPTPSPVDNSAATQALEIYVSQQIDIFNKDLNTANNSLNQISVTSLQYKLHFDELDNKTSQLDRRLGLLELTPHSNSLSSQDVHSIVNNVLEQIHNATVDGVESADGEKLQSITSGVQNVSTHISLLHSQINQLNSSVQHVSGFLDIGDSLGTLMKYVETNDERVKDIETHIDQVESRVENLETAMYSVPKNTSTPLAGTPLPWFTPGPRGDTPGSADTPEPREDTPDNRPATQWPREDTHEDHPDTPGPREDTPDSPDTDRQPSPPQHSTSSTPKPLETANDDRDTAAPLDSGADSTQRGQGDLPDSTESRTGDQGGGGGQDDSGSDQQHGQEQLVKDLFNSL